MQRFRERQGTARVIQDRICADYEDNIKRQKDFIDDLRKQISRLERQNDVLESRCNDKDREIQDMRRRTADAESNVKSGLHSNIKAEGQLAKKEEKLQSTLTALREAQTLLKNAETKIESQKKEITTDKQLIGDLKQMNTDLKNKFEGLLSLRRRTERDCASQEGKTLEKTKENEELTFKNDNLSKKLAEANERNEQLKETIQKVTVFYTACRRARCSFEPR